MERVDAILRHPTFTAALAELHEQERERIFCRHGLEHLLDVARLMYIYDREAEFGIAQETLYAAALLHDIGRAVQYRDGTPHDEAGARLARPILEDCGFTEQEIMEILTAIGGHRAPGVTAPLGRLLYRADKKSRPCYACPAVGECNWPEEKKNHSLES